MDDTSRRVGAGEAEDALDNDTARRTDAIRHEIEETRSELSETIDAIQEKLRPRNIVANTAERVKDATSERMKDMASTAAETVGGVMAQTRQAAGGFTESVRQNPIPAALVGIGTAWLLMNRTSGGQRGSSGEYTRGSNRYLPDDEWVSRSTTPGVVDRLRENPLAAALTGFGLTWLAFAGGDRSPRYSRYRSAGDTRSARSAMSDTAGEITSRAQEYAGDASAAIRRTGRRTRTQLERMVEQNPLMVGAGALVLGAAIGLAVPETEQENEWMGEARDSVVDRAQEMARGAASRVQQAAGEVVGDVTKNIVSGGGSQR